MRIQSETGEDAESTGQFSHGACVVGATQTAASFGPKRHEVVAPKRRGVFAPTPQCAFAKGFHSM